MRNVFSKIGDSVSEDFNKSIVFIGVYDTKDVGKVLFKN